MQSGLLLLHAGEQNEIICQVGQPFGLCLDVADSFVFPVVHGKNLRIGIEDGQRCFQFVSGIGDELLLLFVVFQKWPHNASVQKNQQQQNPQRTDKRYSDTSKQQCFKVIQSAAAIEEQDERCG